MNPLQQKQKIKDLEKELKEYKEEVKEKFDRVINFITESTLATKKDLEKIQAQLDELVGVSEPHKEENQPEVVESVTIEEVENAVEVEPQTKGEQEND